MNPAPKIEISGIVYQRDGKTPAKDVVIYIYHTDQAGHYTAKAGQTGRAKRHGYIRGWVKTDKMAFINSIRFVLPIIRRAMQWNIFMLW